MHPISKILIITGLVFVTGGLLYNFGLGRLPGDIVIKKDNFTLYLPIATSIILSVIASLILALFNR
ncbi:MAG: DUF2905 domain-containing protein [Elusimicrobiota bacterium]